MFKSFPITVLMNHIYPMMKNVRYGQRLDYAAQIAIGTTALGGLALQAKEVTKGRTPRDVEDWKFWQAAMLQGGGLGLFGDFLFAEYSRFGRDPFVEFTGPVVGLASDVARTFKGNLERSADGKDSRFLKDMFNLAKRNTPALNLWYSRLIMDRLLLDNIERAVDPKFDKNLRRMERRWQRETGQKYWWRKGDMTPRGI
jgi:hypothetical protein